MRNKRRYKLMGTLAVLATVCLLLTWIYLQGLREKAKERSAEAPVESPSRVSVIDGETVVALDVPTQVMGGVIVKPIAGAQVPSSGVVWLGGKSWIFGIFPTI